MGKGNAVSEGGKRKGERERRGGWGFEEVCVLVPVSRIWVLLCSVWIE